MNPEPLDLSRYAGHTLGPLVWRASDKGPYLATQDRGCLLVMSPAHSGMQMQRATVRFAYWDGICEGEERGRRGGIMRDGLLLPDGRMHPDAALLEDATKLLAEVVRLREERDALLTLANRVREIAEFYARYGAVCTFEGEGMAHLSHIEELAALEGGK